MDKYHVIMKGSPERITEMCSGKSATTSFASTLASLTGRGLRVIAFAAKTIEGDRTTTLSRDEAERDLSFLGLLVLENPLKSDTHSVIERI